MFELIWGYTGHILFFWSTVLLEENSRGVSAITKATRRI
jgi:hypothetical protein